MAHFSPPHTAGSLPDDDPDVLRDAACPICHASTAMTAHAIAGGEWRCARCGQHWDLARLAAVAAYEAWTVDRDRLVKRSTNGSHDSAHVREPGRS